MGIISTGETVASQACELLHCRSLFRSAEWLIEVLVRIAAAFSSRVVAASSLFAIAFENYAGLRRMTRASH